MTQDAHVNTDALRFCEQNFDGIPGLRAALASATRWGEYLLGERGDVLYVFGYHLAWRLLTRLPGKGARLLDRLCCREGALRDWYERLLITNDGPAHTRMKGAVARHFTPAALRRHRSTAAALVSEGLREVIAARQGDLVDALRHVPIRLMASILGVPHKDLPALIPLVEDIEGLSHKSEEALLAADHSIASLLQHVEQLLDARRASPADDLLSALVNANLDREEMAAFATNMLAISHEPVLSQLGCSLFAILRSPGALEGAAMTEERLQYVVEESIRLEPAIDYADRMVLEPAAIAGGLRPPGTLVLCSLAAANRDPAVWSEPERFMPERFLQPACPRVLSFGGGFHHCLGAALVRLMLGETIRQLARGGSPVLSIPAAQVGWVSTLASRPSALPVTLQ